MDLELGIVLDLSGDEPVDLARRAEVGDLDLIVVVASEGEALHGSDLWTGAVFVAGATKAIPIAIGGDDIAPDPANPEVPIAAVVAKARQSLDRLAASRLLVGDHRWVVAAPDADWGKIQNLAADGLPVAVPVATVDDVNRVVAMGAGRTRQERRRSAAARSRRRDGIDYEGVPASLRTGAIEPGDADYRAVRSNYLRGGAPGIVLRPRTPAEVADALEFARRHTHLPLGVRSAGHGVSGRSTNDGGVVIDVGGINHIEVLDQQRRLVRIGPGATWKQVAAALDPYGWAIGSGDYGGVGVGGLATAGGIGLLSRNHGLTIDNLKAVELVLADGTLVRATEDEHPNLFWAVRGAGANFGVATAFEFEASEVGEVGWAKFVMFTANLQQALLRYGELASTAPRDTTVFLVTGPPRQGQSVLQLFAMVDSGDQGVIVDRLTPFLDLGDVVQQEAYVTRYRDVMAEAHDLGPDGHQGGGEPVSRSALVPAITPEVAQDFAALLRSRRVFFFQLRAMGGAIGDTPSEVTAFSHREAGFQVTAMGADESQIDAVWRQLVRHFDGIYLSFDTDRRPERLNDAFPPPVLARLRALKRQYDPHNLFRDNFNINPTVVDDTATIDQEESHA